MRQTVWCSAIACALTAFSQSPSAATARPQKIEVSVERRVGKGAERVDPGFVFAHDDAIRFRFKINFNGYLYVMNHATSGHYVQLFPKQDTGLDNRVVKDREYVLPANDSGWFTFAEPPGYELVYWVVSPARLPGASPAADSIEPRPDQMTPRCDDAIFQARGVCIDAGAGPRAVPDSAALPASIGGKTGIMARELTLTKDGKKTSVVAQDGGAAPLVYLFRVAHK